MGGSFRPSGAGTPTGAYFLRMGNVLGGKTKRADMLRGLRTLWDEIEASSPKAITLSQEIVMNLQHLGSDFTTNADAILDQLQDRATARGINLSALLPDLLLWTILRWETNVGVAVLQSMGVDCWELQLRLDSFLRERDSRHTVAHSKTEARDWAAREALAMGHEYKGVEHLLLGALSAADTELRSFLSENHLEYEKVKEATKEFFRKHCDSPCLDRE